ncbi:recombinase family protein [Paracoccus contaminans]|uniref:recombinase family protein n=1 Tax=Paracoccus contaminans TaxID=1945662 RepID=UPI00146ED96B|nr:recombinase family protein [Paracoccus contaminans]
MQTYTGRAALGASLLRSSIQQLLADAGAGPFDVVVAEALDRLSRNQADVASLHQQLAFHGVTIETLSEGPINELHIGLP